MLSNVHVANNQQRSKECANTNASKLDFAHMKLGYISSRQSFVHEFRSFDLALHKAPLFEILFFIKQIKPMICDNA